MPQNFVPFAVIACIAGLGCRATPDHSTLDLGGHEGMQVRAASVAAAVESCVACESPAAHSENNLVENDGNRMALDTELLVSDAIEPDHQTATVSLNQPMAKDDRLVESGTLTIGNQQYEVRLLTIQNTPATKHSLAVFQGRRATIQDYDAPEIELPTVSTERTLTPNPESISRESSVVDSVVEPMSAPPVVFASGDETLIDTLDLNLPSALAMVGGDHPAVAFARWRVQEAYAELAAAEAMWLPSIQAGLSMHRHDGHYQASDGRIVDVNRNSFQFGLGTGATGAGTTPRPGLVARFHLADAIFVPEFAKKTAWAQGHAANSVLNRQLHEVSQAYLDLVAAHQEQGILTESHRRMNELWKITDDFAQAGEGLTADADRTQTELTLVELRQEGARARASVASARLAQALSMDSQTTIIPMDVVAVPLDMVPDYSDKGSLVATGLATRPELKESQALVAAACEAYQREKYAPFVPSVVLGFSTGGFGGGLGPHSNSIDSRYDLDALMSWEVRNMGRGEQAARRRSSARVQQAKFQKLNVMDQIAREIREAHSLVEHSRRQMEIAAQAIEYSEASFQKNLSRIKDGEGLPLEVLQSVQAVETANLAYLQSVVDHNRAQFQLQWALGWPVSQEF